MELAPYVAALRADLASAAQAGGDDARALADRLTAPLESATRLALLNALTAAMSEVTLDLAPGSVDVRLRGLDPEFVVTLPATPEPAPTPAPTAPAPEDSDAGTARINLRLPGHLKSRVDDAAARENLSVNAWLVRAVAAALDGTRPASPPPTTNASTQRYTGWVR
ncbi:toxin-antitoxin system HicB family antitoxin [Cryptosporangium phraense]|uniref:Toxin-antitoxin system HicB family antitoxin n=1 Tax=Cryptosporangium phraense TaxID=2593070 RepID=A0A545AVN1_9ACTN|nr:toxin-antitoxin system HicB family antitoxin [Cryptosporangium phraense]TQS44655.1 toxin-antitoxin system HicB family antitoxin [Cryptosporangium phraense]